MAQHIDDLCEDRARQGDGPYAIAYALLQLARAQERTAKALRDLGNGNATTDMGAIEAFGAVMEDGMESLTSAIDGLRAE